MAAREDLPLVLELEDLHWADRESLAFLGYLAEVNRDLALLMLAFTRPTLFERHPDWVTGNSAGTRIDLQPLDKDLCPLLADELLKRLPEIPATLRDLLISSADGNPFYMEELVKMWIDRGAIIIGESWTVDIERLSMTRIPATLTGVLQARLDGLPTDERLALQQASVAAGGTLEGCVGRLVELTCYDVLNRVGDERAGCWLTRAHDALMAQADGLTRAGGDATLRQHFLHNIPYHREILAAWAQRPRSDD